MLRDYECASRWPDGMEFGDAVSIGFSPPVDRKFAGPEDVRLIEGYATRYNKVHPFGDYLDVFRPGVFARSLLKNTNIRFLEDHDEGKLLATTADGSLKLTSDAKGLSFQARIPNATEAQVRAIKSIEVNGKACMSVGYRVISSEMHRMEGVDVRLINDASLSEISLVKAGAVKEAFAYLVKSDGRSTFDDGGNLETEKAYSDLMGSLRALQEKLGSAK